MALAPSLSHPPDRLRPPLRHQDGGAASTGNPPRWGRTCSIVNLAVEGNKEASGQAAFEVIAVDDRANDTGSSAKQLVDAGVVADWPPELRGQHRRCPDLRRKHPADGVSITPNSPRWATPHRPVANDTLQAKAIGSFASFKAKYALLLTAR
jgi:hypothetical protein